MNPHDATEQAFNNGKIKGAREFAERLKKKYSRQYTTSLWKVLCETTDETLKEMERDSSAGS